MYDKTEIIIGRILVCDPNDNGIFKLNSSVIVDHRSVQHKMFKWLVSFMELIAQNIRAELSWCLFENVVNWLHQLHVE